MARVGRARKTDKHLPRRVYLNHGAYFFVDLKGKWHPLGKSYPDALIVLARLLQADMPTGTFAFVCAKYEADEIPKKARRTQQGRRQEFKPLRKVFANMQVEDIEPHHVWNYWKARGETVQARHEVRALSTVLTYARRIGALKTDNPCFGLRLPDHGHRSRYVTDEEFLLVRSCAPTMIAYAMDLALVGGMDQSTIRALERRHITADGIQFERGKTKALQLIEWNEELDVTLKAILREAPQLRRALICNRQGKAYSLNGFQSQWQRVMRKAMKAGLTERFHFHDLRAKSGSEAASDQEAADRLGHGDVKLTRRVYRRLPRRAAAWKVS